MRWSLALLALALLSGCAAPAAHDAPSASAPSSDAAHGAAIVAGEGAAPPLRLDGVEPFDRTLWANGTFAPTDTCDAGQCLVAGFVGGSHTHSTDVSPGAQQDVPLRVRAWLGTAASAGALELRFDTQAPRLSVAIHSASEAGAAFLDALVVPDGSPVYVKVFAQRPDPAGLDYTLRIRVESHPDLLTPGIPYGLTLPADATLTVAAANPPPLRVWDPQDRYLGLVRPAADGTLRLGAAGEYVLVVASSGDAIPLAAHGTLRILRAEYRDGPVRDEVGQADDTWKLDLPDGGPFPLAVGLRMANDGGTVEPSVSLTGPAGPVLEAGPDHQSFPVDAAAGGGDHFWMSTLADPGLVAGAYTAHVAVTAPQPAATRIVQLAYLR